MEEYILTTEALAEDGEWTDEKFVTYSSDKRKLIKSTFDIIDNSYTVLDSTKIICDSAFHRCKKLKSIILSDNLITIGKFAFFECINLTSIELPETLKKIGESAFWRCESLTSITLPEDILIIEDGAFEWCPNLKVINIPFGTITKFLRFKALEGIQLREMSLTSEIYENEEVWIDDLGVSYSRDKKRLIRTPQNINSYNVLDGTVVICDHAFSESHKLATLTFPNSLKIIGKSLFNGCWNLTSINIEDSDIFFSINGILYGYDKTLIYYPCAKSDEYFSIPNGIESIKDNAFLNCGNLTHITFPNSIKKIGNYAFSNCNLISIKFPEGLISIGNDAFRGSALNSIDLPNTLTEIGDSAFAQCSSLSSIILPNKLTQISAKMFTGCYKLSKITLPNNLTKIGNYAFNGTKITKLNLPSSLSVLDINPFISTSFLTELNIEYSSFFYSIDGVLFSHDKCLIHYPAEKKQENYKVPDGTLTIGDSAFASRNLKTITFPKSITKIGKDVFSSCWWLNSITFSNIIVSLDYNPLKDMPNFNNVYIPKGTRENFRFDSFDRIRLIEI